MSIKPPLPPVLNSFLWFFYRIFPFFQFSSFFFFLELDLSGWKEALEFGSHCPSSLFTLHSQHSCVVVSSENNREWVFFSRTNHLHLPSTSLSSPPLLIFVFLQFHLFREHFLVINGWRFSVWRRPCFHVSPIFRALFQFVSCCSC